MTDDSRRAPSHKAPVSVAPLRQAEEHRRMSGLPRLNQALSKKTKKEAAVFLEQSVNVQIVRGFFFLYVAVQEESCCSACSALALARVR